MKPNNKEMYKISHQTFTYINLEAGHKAAGTLFFMPARI